MPRKCDLCDNKATHHSVEIVKGQKIEKHLCDEHAAEQGLAIKSSHAPVHELLTNFVKIHSGVPQVESDETCDECGLAFSEFRETSLLGCPQCYEAFEKLLEPLLERAHDGELHHLGKVPSRFGGGEQRQAQLLRMRQRLTDAVAAEDYELAARMRDEINKFEKGDG